PASRARIALGILARAIAFTLAAGPAPEGVNRAAAAALSGYRRREGLAMLRISVLLLVFSFPAHAFEPPPNPLIDYDGFAKSVAQVRDVRESRRVSEAEFIRMASEPGTVVLDARSERLFLALHVAGAVNLSFPEFTRETLATAIPTRATRILIYCNNNFIGAPSSMPTKALGAALNLSTFVSLRTYGYENVYELAPAIDVAAASLRFEGEEVPGRHGPATTAVIHGDLEPLAD
ncbi:MAG TPA: rhodanese-like domain-containing protein, partial [Usitatibacter sp.]